MYQTLYLLRYNNYYNRQLKKFNTLDEYTPYVLDDIITDINFVSNDGVSAEQVVNWTSKLVPDYLLAVDQDDDTFTRWFILDAIRLRNSQYKLILRRDLLADYYDEFINSTAMIEKATLKDTDPYIYNYEGQQYNQIKKSETPLKDATNSAWVVGYIPRDAFPKGEGVKDIKKKIDITYYTDNANIEKSFDTMADYEAFFKYTSDDNEGYTDVILNQLSSRMVVNALQTVGGHPGGNRPIDVYFKNEKAPIFTILPQAPEVFVPSIIPHTFEHFDSASYQNPTLPALRIHQDETGWHFIKSYPEIYTEFYSNLASYSPKSVIKEYIKLLYKFPEVIGFNITPNISHADYANKIIKVEGIKYRVKLNTFIKTSSDTQIKVTDASMRQEISRILVSQITNANAQIKADGVDYDFYNTVDLASIDSIEEYMLSFGLKGYYFSLEPTDIASGVTLEIPFANDRQHLLDQPFDMFCMPYSDNISIEYALDKKIKGNKQLALGVSQDIAKAVGSGNVYDIQVLPYCPAREYIKSDGIVDVGFGRYDTIKNANNEDIGIIIWCQQSTFTFDINKPIDIIDYKQQSNTDMWRLCSPNYAGVFEFNASKNRGVTKYSVDCTYQPFSPYIHINPIFKQVGLYGGEYNDSRGLICGGDFSLPQLSNSWANYQLNNKNYQASFDRQIQSMDTMHNIQQDKTLVNGAIGALGAAASSIGAFASGNIGQGVMGISAGAGLIAGTANSMISNTRTHNEARDKAIDEFNYNLDNIKAIPSSLTKTTALTANNKIFPFVEYYTCTTEEKQAFNDKIKWTGMTVMRVGRPKDYIKDSTFMQGNIIRINIKDEFHLATELAGEFSKGIYIGDK